MIWLSILAEILTAVYCALLYSIALISQLVIVSFQSRSLYVTNLNFKTSDENLWKHVSDNMKEGKILSVRVSTSHIWEFEHFNYCSSLYLLLAYLGSSLQIIKDLKNGKNVSMGYGFIEFDSVETATNVCRDVQVIWYHYGKLSFSTALILGFRSMELCNIYY